MWFATATIRISIREFDGAIEGEATVRLDVNVLRLEVGGSIDEADGAGLHEVVGDDDVLLIRCDFDIVGADEWLHFVRVIEALDVLEVGDIQGGDVVGGSDGD